MSYQVHNFQTGEIIEAAPVNEMDQQIQTNERNISGKADKVSSATEGNFASLDSEGNIVDSGHKHSDYLTQHQDISGKADKVSGATSGNFASLDSNGNLIDSGHKHSDYTLASEVGTVPSGQTVEGQITALNGKVVSLEGRKANAENLYMYKEATPGPIVTVDDAVAEAAKQIQIGIEPVQNLNGYDKPWPAGGGVNQFPYTIEKVYTNNGVTIKSDGNGKYTMTGTCTGTDYTTFTFPEKIIIPDGETYKFCFMNSQALDSNTFIAFMNGNTIVDSWSAPTANKESNYTGMSGKECTAIRMYMRNGQTYNMTLTPMFVPKTTTVTDYIPYSNICPIIGWSAVKINRTGRNLFSASIESGAIDSSDGTTTSNNKRLRFNDYVLLKAGTYTISCAEEFQVAPILYNIGKQFVTPYGSTPGNIVFGDCPSTITLTEDYYVKCVFKKSNNAVISATDISKVQINIGTTAETHEAFGNTYEITIPSTPGTVYGGSLTINNDGSGILAVDKAIKTITSSTTINGYSKNSNNAYRVQYSISGEIPGKANTTKEETLCNAFQQQNPSSCYNFGTVMSCALAESGAYILITLDSSFSDVQKYRDLVDDIGGITVVYPVGTPTVYDLTASQVNTIITTLNGANNIYANSGDILSFLYATEKYNDDHYANRIYSSVENQAIASFSDGSDGLPINVTVGIEPVQEGSGDPSPENVRPISGWDAVKISRTGKNLLDYFITDFTYSASNDGSVSKDTTNKEITVSAKANNSSGVYISTSNRKKISDLISMANSKGIPIIASMKVKTASGNKCRIRFMSSVVEMTGNGDYQTFTQELTSNGEITFYGSANNSGVITFQIKDLQIEVGTIATSYEPYIGQTYEITIPSTPGTVYGGSLTVNKDGTGKLVVTHSFREFEGAESEEWAVSANRYARIKLTSTKWYEDSKVISNLYPQGIVASDTDVINISYTSGGGDYLYIHPSWMTSETTADDIKEYLASHALQAVLEYTEEHYFEYDLTVSQVNAIITSLKGVNNIFADAGNIISVEYAADTKEYIDKKADKIQNATGGNLVISDDNGDPLDSGYNIDDLHDDINAKADIINVVDTDIASVKTITDGADGRPVGVTIGIEPVQNLNGLDAPYPGGFRKNKWPLGDITEALMDVSVSIPAGTYVMSGVGENNADIRFYYADETSTLITSAIGQTFELTDDCVKLNIALTGTGEITNVQLEPGTTASDFIPYSNICSIDGRNSLHLSQKGGNLFDATGTRAQCSGTYVQINNKHSITVTSSASGKYRSTLQLLADYDLEAGKTYRMSAKVTSKSSGTYAEISIRNSSNAIQASYNYETQGTNEGSFEFTYDPAIHNYFSFFATMGTNGTGSVIYDDIILEEAEEKVYDISFPSTPGTIIGGSLTINKDGTGKLSKLTKTITMTGTGTHAGTSFEGKSSSTTANIFYSQLYCFEQNIYEHDLTEDLWSFIRCSHAPAISYSKVTSVIIEQKGIVFTSAFTTSGTVRHQPRIGFPLSSEINTIEKANAFLAEQLANGTPVTYSFPLRVPTEYELTKEQVNWLLETSEGENTFYADSGDILAVDYFANTKRYVDNHNEIEDAAITNIRSMISVSDDPVATVTHAIGDVFICSDQLLRATDVIVAGETINTEAGGNAEIINLTDYIAEKAAAIAGVQNNVDLLEEKAIALGLSPMNRAIFPNYEKNVRIATSGNTRYVDVLYNVFRSIGNPSLSGSTYYGIIFTSNGVKTMGRIDQSPTLYKSYFRSIPKPIVTGKTYKLVLHISQYSNLNSTNTNVPQFFYFTYDENDELYRCGASGYYATTTHIENFIDRYVLMPDEFVQNENICVGMNHRNPKASFDVKLEFMYIDESLIPESIDTVTLTDLNKTVVDDATSE